MEKIEFKNYEDSPTTPINAQALNKMQDNIEQAISEVEVDVDFTELENAIDSKADKSNTYTKAEVDTELGGKVDKKLPPRAETTNLDFDKTEDEWGTIRHDIVTDNVSTGKPAGNGFVTTFFWDTSGNYDSQLYIPNSDNSRRPQWRSRSNKDEWGEWINLYPETIIDGDRQAIKFPDGTMINTIKVSVNFEDYVTDDTTILSFNFLTEFVDIPDSISHSIVINPTHKTLVSLSTNLSSVNNKGGNLLVTHNGLYANRNSFVANITAIGKWK